MSSLATRIVILLAAAIWTGIAFALDIPIGQDWLRLVGIVSSSVVLLVLVFDILLWRYVPTFISKVPNIRGTWKCRLRSDWTEPNGSNVELDCYLTVRQTFSRVSADMLFPESNSSSTSASLEERNGRYTLWFSYQSAAFSINQSANPPHRGAASLIVSTSPATHIEGDYWTERKTNGRITTLAYNRKLFDSFHLAGKNEFKPL